MALTPVTKDDLRDRVDVLEVIGLYVRLKKAGTEYRGICPFHEEKTPSFYVNAEKGLWVCRGACGEGGDIFRFVMKAEKMEFLEAAEWLANRIGCTLQTSQADLKRQDQRQRVLEICRLATGLFERHLRAGKGAEAARRYLAERGLSESIIQQFRLGYAPPEWDRLTSFLGQRDLSLEDAAAAGLVRRRERSAGYYDYFRGRIMFPILDPQGRTVGFGGRVIDPHDSPKYLNSPESPLFSKRRLLYGLPFAIPTLEEGALVVEGYMDVIALHQHGVTQAIATLGTSLTAEQIRLLRRHTGRVTLCYDADTAGARATDRAAAAFVEEGVDGRVLTLPSGQDPDEFVRTAGREVFAERLGEAPDLVDYRIRTALAAVGNDPGARAEVVREAVVAMLGDIRDEVRQAQYVRRIAEWWAGEAVGLQAEFERTLTRALARRAGPRDRRRPAEPQAPRGGRAEKVERELLRHLLHDASRRAVCRRELGPELFTDETHRALYTAIVAAETDAESALDAPLAELDGATQTLAADLFGREPDSREDFGRTLVELKCLATEAELNQLRTQLNHLSAAEVDAQLDLLANIRDIEQRLEKTRLELLSRSGGNP